MDYNGHYDINEYLANNPRLIPSPTLYNFDDERLYAALMNRLAEPLPTGEESPFSNQSPGTAHAALLSVLAYMQSLMGHQFNLIPDLAWIQWFRTIGVELESAQYPIINLVFYRSGESTRGNIDAEIPIGTTVRSRFRADLSAITTRTMTITGTDTQVIVPARLSQLGAAPETLRRGEFTSMAQAIRFIDRVENDGTIVSPGRSAESLVEAMLRAREGIRTGNLGRFYVNGVFNASSPDYVGRCVNARDFEYYALRLGATKANVLTPMKDRVSDVVIVIYPSSVRSDVEPPLIAMSLSDRHVDILDAEIIPINGNIQLRCDPNLSDSEVRNRAALAIFQSINPPKGIWGDINFYSNLAVILEKIPGVYAVPAMTLKRSDTNQPLEAITPEPWQLFEIQDSITFEAMR